MFVKTLKGTENKMFQELNQKVLYSTFVLLRVGDTVQNCKFAQKGAKKQVKPRYSRLLKSTSNIGVSLDKEKPHKTCYT
jgi:hypothetical protein